MRPLALMGPRPAGGLVLAARPPMTRAPGLAGALAMSGAPAASSGPVAELRLIALFVAKWKLDPARTKPLLARLTLTRRRFVIESFKASPGQDPNVSLSLYVLGLARANAWGSPGAASAPQVARAIGPTAQGVKRPIAAPLVGVKRPRLGAPGAAAPAAVRPMPKPTPKPTAKAQAPMAVRPARPTPKMPVPVPRLVGVRPMPAARNTGVIPPRAVPSTRSSVTTMIPPRSKAVPAITRPAPTSMMRQ